MKKLTTLMILVVAAAFPAAAGHYGDFYVIPAAAHTPGNSGTFFRTDLAIYNFQPTTLIVDLALVESSLDGNDNVFPIGDSAHVIAPDSSLLLSDLLEDYREMDSATGAILVSGNQAFAVTSRTYNTEGGDGTFGQTVPGVRDFIDNAAGFTPDMATAYLPGLIVNDDFRTNIGFVVGSNGPDNQALTIKVTLYGENGGVIGSKDYVYPPGAIAHRQFSTKDISPAGFEIGGADVTVTSGNGTVIPYAAVVDNRTGDGNFVLGNFPPSTPTMGKLSGTSIFERIFDSVISNR